ncbi:Zinc finger and BTB domain-containing protein 16-A [Liparis tanakae]|uniref:Zinc finger and BTB domain-containing protein 16-A n=1 Tax=Liparis tanakae TaxID=230148 RepID=A0A4Z2IN40_9TELE|nr:Zinc finger and BTB domain-containing protein 16-A [Liparis tanakae]
MFGGGSTGPTVVSPYSPTDQQALGDQPRHSSSVVRFSPALPFFPSRLRKQNKHPILSSVSVLERMTQPALQQHMEVHAGVRSYICSECNRTFPSHTALKRHLRSHTDIGEDKSGVYNPPARPGRRKKKCHPGSSPELQTRLCSLSPL